MEKEKTSLWIRSWSTVTRQLKLCGRGLGANLTESNAQCLASGLELLDMLLKSIDDDCKLAANIKQRTKGNPEDAVMQIISDLKKKSIHFQRWPGRSPFIS